MMQVDSFASRLAPPLVRSAQRKGGKERQNHRAGIGAQRATGGEAKKGRITAALVVGEAGVLLISNRYVCTSVLNKGALTCKPCGSSAGLRPSCAGLRPRHVLQYSIKPY